MADILTLVLEPLLLGFRIGLLISFAALALLQIDRFYYKVKQLAATRQTQQTQTDGVQYSIYRHPSAQLLSDRSLKSIRLIELLPAETENSSIRIRIRVTPLKDNLRVRYEAISYCWGNPKDSLPVFHENNNPIWITRSLWTSLRKFRHKNKVRLLWADAICINQNDEEEKSWQVAMMTDIYKYADQVLIWLGEEFVGSSLLPAFIDQLLYAKMLQSIAEDQRRFFELRKEDFTKYHLPNNWDPRFIIFFRLLRSQWFQRVWIIQELALAKSAIVHFAHTSIPWESLFSAWVFIVTRAGEETIYNVDHTTIFGLSALGATANEMARAIRQPLLMLLFRHRPALATDARDKIFALAGISKEYAIDTSAIIDYGIAVSEVYTRIAWKIIECSKNLDILSHNARHTSDSADPSLPSWVPDWRTRGLTAPLTAPATSFNASKNSTVEDFPLLSELCIRLQGYEVDSVAIVGSLCRLASSRKVTVLKALWYNIDYTHTLLEWDRICEAHSGKTYLPTGEGMCDVFWKTLVVNSYSDDIEQLRREFAAFYHQIRFLRVVNKLLLPLNRGLLQICYGLLFYLALLIYELTPILNIQEVRASSAKRRKFVTRLLPIFGRRMIRTSSGFVGLVSGEVKPGDIVMVMKGGKVPYVLRTTEKKNILLFVGDCYLHGLMEGDKWDSSRCQDLWLS